MMPTYATKGSAGADLYSTTMVDIEPGEWVAVPTGVTGTDVFGEHFQIRNYAALIMPRSGLALNKGLTVLNAPGVIDSDYKDEIKVILINHSGLIQTVFKRDRIAQLVMVPYVVHAGWEIKEQTRNGGFGSTGVNDD